jgi:hypothetical protein
MKRSTVMLLVCLVFFNSALIAYSYQNQHSINVVVDPGGGQSYNAEPASYAPASESLQTSAIPMLASGPETQMAAFRPHIGYARPITKVTPAACPPPVACGPKPDPPCILPRRMPRQWEISAQAFFPRLSGTVQWPAAINGVPTEEVSITDDLGLPKHPVLGEYSAYYQINWNWSIYYSIMPISLSATTTANRSFYFGNWAPVPIGSQIRTDWNFIYQRLGLMYTAINTCNANLSIYTAWLYNPQEFKVSCSVCPNWPASKVDRDRQMLMSGIDLKKCIRTLCNGSTLSCDTKASIGYLDNTLVLDIQPGMRFSVPLNCGRWGFVKGGYRWLNFNESRNDLKLNLYLEGGFVEGGLIF